MKLKDNKNRNVKDKPKFIVCFDNVEELVENEGKKFRKFLADILVDCPNLTIIVTSSKALTGPHTGQLPHGI